MHIVKELAALILDFFWIRMTTLAGWSNQIWLIDIVILQIYNFPLAIFRKTRS